MSTENLMLNAYRQTAAGGIPYLALDFTYRIFQEGHGLMPVMTVSPGQKGHIIACAISDARTKNHISNFFDRLNPRSSALCDPSPVK